MPDHACDRGAVRLDPGASRSQAYQPDPVDLGAQSDLIGVPEPMSIEAVLAAPNGGSRSYARPRLVTLGEGLPGGFPVHCEVQGRSYDPGTRDDRAE
jgi:hypothetical protein